MRRRPMGRKESRRVFKKGARRVHKKNVVLPVMRGGYRL